MNNSKFRVSDLPVSESIKMRPVWERHRKRYLGATLEPPNEREKHDAVLVLRDHYPPIYSWDLLLLREAERIFAESAEDGRFT